MFSILEVTAKTSFSKISKRSNLVTTVYFSLWDNFDWGSDDEDDSYELSYDDSGSMFQMRGKAIDMGNGEIPYCVNGQWNENDQKCDCFPGFVESQDDDEV